MPSISTTIPYQVLWVQLELDTREPMNAAKTQSLMVWIGIHSRLSSRLFPGNAVDLMGRLASFPNAFVNEELWTKLIEYWDVIETDQRLNQ